MDSHRLDRGIAEEDVLRAHYYRFLSRLLKSPPSAAVLELTAALDGDDTAFGQALTELARAAAATAPEPAANEYQDLFIGLGRGELVPFGSFYLTGFLHEKPLARLREDMAGLGIERTDDVKEPEDHIACLCEIMGGLILGAFGEPADLATQRLFFGRHIEPWAEQFFSDLEAAQSAAFYRPVGTMGRLLMAIEGTAFRMTD